MTTEKFEIILQNPESELLDFKSTQYDIHKGTGDVNTAKFVKDIISFSNTIRTEAAFIIIGIDIETDGTKILSGLNKNIDDAIFQDKLKNKVTPVPSFKYYTFDYQNKKFGILEIPVKKYPEPIFPVIKMKGLESGKVYFRRGSTNSEASGRETILINKWLESLPAEIENSSLTDEVSELMIKATSPSAIVSECIAESLVLAKKYNLQDLRNFCNIELTGIYSSLENIDAEKNLSYRMNKVIMSTHSIEVNPYSFNSLSSDQMINELRKMDGFHERQILFNQPITEIENILNRFTPKQDSSIVVLTSPADRVFNNPKWKGNDIKIYASMNNFNSVYQGIKQKLINLLLEIK